MRFTVLKFGGTSVATAGGWASIARRATEVVDAGGRAWVVVSALAGVTNALEGALRDAASGDAPARDRAIEDALADVRARHDRLASDLGLGPGAPDEVHAALDDADRRIEGVRLLGEAPPRVVARVLACGELASSALGLAFLAHHGLDVTRVDSRDLLETRARRFGGDHAAFLDARVATRVAPDEAERLAGDARVVIAPGFVARRPTGETALLGRGGSDTSAALLAARVDAEALELWSDVPGLFTADPREIPGARLLRTVGYREACELAATGAKVLHPRCLDPVAAAGIPVRLRSTIDPGLEGTEIGTDAPDSTISAVTCRRGVVLLSIASTSMWEEPGFLARLFEPFGALGVSVDLVGTSQAAVSVTLDRLPGDLDGPVFRELLERLGSLGDVDVRHPCGVVSIIGRHIRSELPEVGPALDVFRDWNVHLVTNSAEDLNLSFVVDEPDVTPLLARLHARLFPSQGGDPRLGATWETLVGPASDAVPGEGRWWRARRAELVERCGDGRARYVYDLATVAANAARLRAALPRVEPYYSIKANPHPEILETVRAHGFGLECVSIDEVRHARRHAGADAPILFTPNFCPIGEYAEALELGAEVVVDGVEPLTAAPETFRGVALGLRLDPGAGRGHHDKVRTAGAHAKFGLRVGDAPAFAETAAHTGARVVGLHAHVGSGILDPHAWSETAARLAEVLDTFPECHWVDLGGGLGVAERPGTAELDLEALAHELEAARRRLGDRTLRLEPGRYVVADAGALLAPVTQVRRKGDVSFVGVATGMNSLIRPALYGAWHSIYNLSRLDDPTAGYAHVVGPICETGDVLGRDRALPATEPGDVLLVDHAGAYGAVMASRYNLREPAETLVLRDL